MIVGDHRGHSPGDRPRSRCRGRSGRGDHGRAAAGTRAIPWSRSVRAAAPTGGPAGWRWCPRGTGWWWTR